MRYRRAIEKIRILAEACRDFKRFPSEEPFLLEAYVFGDVLRGVDPLDFVEVALVLNLPPEEVIWETTPRGTEWLADYLRLSKGGFAYFWRSHLDPVSNHHIRGPVRFWSLAGRCAAGRGTAGGARPPARCARLLLGLRVAPGEPWGWSQSGEQAVGS